MAYENRHNFRGGRIAVYTRANSKKCVFQVRFKLDGMREYIVESLHTSVLHEAPYRAEVVFDDCSYKHRQGIDLRKGRLTFAQGMRQYLDSGDLTISRQRLFSITNARYFTEFFGSYQLADMTTGIFSEYFPWRRAYWSAKRIEGKQRIPPNAADPPSPKTLQMELGMLKQFLRWAERRNLITKVPALDKPSFMRSRDGKRRASFTTEELPKVRIQLDKWCTEVTSTSASPGGGSLHKSGPNSSHRRQRWLVRDLFSLLIRSGMRPGEPRNLRWRNIDERSDGTIVIYVPLASKTGTREVVCSEGVKEVFDRIRTYSGFTKPNDPIFCTINGTPLVDMNQTFQAFLTWSNMLLDVHEQRRCLYSLRHVYASEQLKAELPIYWLAKNMGTSVKFIEQNYSHVIPTNKLDLLSNRLVALGPARSTGKTSVKARWIFKTRRR